MQLTELFINKNKSSGVHPHGNKIAKDKEIEKLILPKEVTIPLAQHIGAPAESLVKKGDEVKAGQKIAEIRGFCSANIHATISGKVKNIVKQVSSVTSGVVDAIVIESDDKDEWIKLQPVSDPAKLTKDEIIEKVKEAGIVGMGGATFPTHIKLNPPANKKIDTIIVNGCECEPFITSDHRLMLENGEEIIKGLELMMKAVGCNKAYIGIEDNKPDAIKGMRKVVTKLKPAGLVLIEPLEQRYPMGAEKTLLKRILGREVPIGGLPMDVGVVVQNVATLKAIYDAIYLGKPLVERVVTITGEVNEPKNIMVRFGTSARDIIDVCGGAKPDADVMIFGGPMMGIAQTSFNVPVQKGTNCILLQKNVKKPESDCIRCGSCVETCPMNLMPTMYVALVKKNMY
ncbi:MAG: electron transport complex subunit RsxC, partial [Candidatus Thermoplasmatota archaeon]|nr:electron transport complex subunit RsxC [Candidatus Thermoplasmatota archaeon]